MNITAIDFPQLRNAEFIQFLKDVSSLCQAKNPETLQISSELKQVLDMVNLLDAAFNREQSSKITKIIEQLDAERDACIIGIRALIVAYTYHYEQNIKVAAVDLLKILDHYGSNLARFNYQAQTETLSRLISDLESQKNVLEALGSSHLITWIERMKTLNQEFGEQYLARTKEYASLPKQTFLEMRREAVEKYRTLTAMLVARYTINAASENPLPAYEILIQEINALTEQYNQVIDNRTGSDDRSYR